MDEPAKQSLRLDKRLNEIEIKLKSKNRLNPDTYVSRLY